MKTETQIEETDNDIGDKQTDITSPFRTKDIRVTNAPVLLPSLIARFEEGAIIIPTFQRRKNLWTLNQMSRLIESILLKLPLPIFYFDVSDPDKWLVVDGLQRLSTMDRFFTKKDFKLRNLEFLQDFNGKGFDDFDRSTQRVIEETIIMTYQIEAQTPKEVRYSIFNRINTGGLTLTAQEIRQALNQKGDGVSFLSNIAETDEFKNIVGISNQRMRGQELILRFMAFQILQNTQFKTMHNFLDLAMEAIDEKNKYELEALEKKLIEVLIFSEKILGKNHKFSRSIVDDSKKKSVNLALFDVLTVSLNSIQDKDLFIQNKKYFIDEFKSLLKNQDSEFLKSITQGTSGKWAKETRFRIIQDLIRKTLERDTK
jgi:hypothetical protein